MRCFPLRTITPSVKGRNPRRLFLQSSLAVVSNTLGNVRLLQALVLAAAVEEVECSLGERPVENKAGHARQGLCLHHLRNIATRFDRILA